MPDPASQDITADDRNAGVRLLRRHHQGTLQHQERVSEVKLIIEAFSGRIVMPVEPGFAKGVIGTSDALLLWIPRESDWDMQLSVNPRLIDRPEGSEPVDRWGAYHGSTSLSTWVQCDIEGAKTDRAVYLGDDIQLANPLGRAEYGLIKLANADRAALSGACKRHAAMLVADALCVGVDPFGLDIRARFGIVRLEFPHGIRATAPEQGQREIERLLNAGAPR